MNEARIRASIESYVAAWNETDGAKRRLLLERGCSEGVRLCTSGRSVDGRVELDAFVADFQRRRPGLRAVLTSAIDVQGHLFRYTGVIEGATVVPGSGALDTGEADEDGRIRLLLTFVGVAPAALAAGAHPV